MCFSYPSDSSRRYKRHSRPLDFLLLITPVLLYPQFFNLDGVKDDYKPTMASFWAVAAPITCIIMAITIYSVIVSQYELRKIVRSIGRLLWQWRIDLPLSQADAHRQGQFLEQLPLYRVKIEKHESLAGTPDNSGQSAGGSGSAAAAPESPVSAPEDEYLLFPKSIDPTSCPHAQAAG